MKKRYIFPFSEETFGTPIAILFIINEILFKQVYLHPVSNIQIGLISIPVYGCSLVFILKIIVFDLPLFEELIGTFISRRYYGFPYPEIFCYPFSALCMINFIFVVLNVGYSILHIRIPSLAHLSEILFSLLQHFSQDPVGFLLQTSFSFNYTPLLPAIPFFLLFLFAYFFYDQKNTWFTTKKGTKYVPLDSISDEIDRKTEVIFPGERDNNDSFEFYLQINGVLLCFIVCFRFLVLMNIHLNPIDLWGLFSFLFLAFFFRESSQRKKRLSDDKSFFYNTVKDTINIDAVIDWKTLLEFNTLELNRLKEIEKKYKIAKIRNTRWLELYEHSIINNLMNVYHAVKCLDLKIYDAKTALEKIEPSIKEIDATTRECMMLLPSYSSHTFENLELIAYLEKEIPALDGVFERNNSISCYHTSADLCLLSAVFKNVKEYVQNYSDQPFTCQTSLDKADWLVVHLSSPVADSENISYLKRDVTRVAQMWTEDHINDYYHYPLKLVIAQLYMQDMNGFMSYRIENNCMVFDLHFSTPEKEAYHSSGEFQEINLVKFLKNYTVSRENMIFSPSDIKTMMLRTNEQLLTEILNNFEYFFSSMLYSKEHSSILITLKKSDAACEIFLSFHSQRIEEMPEFAKETSQYLRNRNAPLSEHISLSLLMLEIKMEQLGGSVDLSSDEDIFNCKLLFPTA